MFRRALAPPAANRPGPGRLCRHVRYISGTRAAGSPPRQGHFRVAPQPPLTGPTRGPHFRYLLSDSLYSFAYLSPLWFRQPKRDISSAHLTTAAAANANAGTEAAPVNSGDRQEIANFAHSP